MKVSVLLAALGLAGCLTACAPQNARHPSGSPPRRKVPPPPPRLWPRAQPAAAEPAAAVGTVLPAGTDAGRSYSMKRFSSGIPTPRATCCMPMIRAPLFTSLSNNIGVVSMGAGAITTLKCEKFKGSSTMYTVPESVAMLKAEADHHLLRHKQPLRCLHRCDPVHRHHSAGAAGHPAGVVLLRHHRKRHPAAGQAARKHEPDDDAGRCLTMPLWYRCARKTALSF